MRNLWRCALSAVTLTAGWGFMFSASAQIPTLTIHAGQAVAPASPIFYGLMTEEINHSYDGGLYAELIQNRAFLNDKKKPADWTAVVGGGAAARIELDPGQPLDRAIPTSLRLQVTHASGVHPAGIANDGYGGIPVKPHTRYRVSFYAKAAAGFHGPVEVSIQSADGRTVYARNRVSGLTPEWRKYRTELTTGNVPETAQARFVLALHQPATVWLSLVSLFPPTWHNQPNGFRPDLMRMLVAMHPKFLRFPGGNYLEGNTIAQRFKWKQTIGPLRDRPGHWSPWGYYSTDGMGLLEFLRWAEDLHAQPVLAVYAGYSLQQQHIPPGPKLEPYVRDALDEIEYVMGPVASQWGAMRARDGHPRPFPLHYVEIGNEDFFDRSHSYAARFAQFRQAIQARYPNLVCISTLGTEAGQWAAIRKDRPAMVDEHYYASARAFLTDAAHFDYYLRKGPQIFVGEWASYDTSYPPWDRRSRTQPPTPSMKSALADAAWMTGMERNSDIVKMNAYAPMLVNVSPGMRQWRPNLIGYDALHVFGSPSYYAIRMFSRNFGDQILQADLPDPNLYGSVTKDSRTKTIFVKLVNPHAAAQPLRIRITGTRRLKATGLAITLAAPPDATNSISHRRNVVPKRRTFGGIKPVFNYTLPADSITVLRLKES